MLKKYKIVLICLVIVLLGVGGFFVWQHNHQYLDPGTTADADEVPVPTGVKVQPEEITNQASDIGALGGYDVLIADRGNNRLIEVTPDKKIVWEYHFDLPKAGLGADDSFFTDDGKSIIVNLEEYHIIEIIDYQTKNVIWTYGEAGKPGSKDGMLNTPDDAYKLPNGNITVADIKNCRILEISPDKKIVRQYGKTRICKNINGYLNKPNGDTPLANGHTFISNIVGRDLIELDENWQPIFSMPLPVHYPSDPQLTKAGNILISDYSNPGKIVEVAKDGTIVWDSKGVNLDHPSLAIELPNGNILTNDDANHRVIVIDKKTNNIIWQYGVTKKPGSGPDQLNTPDGLDIILRTPVATPVTTPLSSVGQITRHSANFINQQIRIQGYVLKKENGYIIFSDEANGTIGQYDLPVTGLGVDSMQSKQKYELQGLFLDHGLTASNHNQNHLELSSLPTLIK